VPGPVLAHRVKGDEIGNMNSVALQVLNGPNAGHRIWVRLEQVLQVGSSDRADVMIATESGADSIDFSIGHSRAGCFAECLLGGSSINVNGREMQRVRLHDGDLLVAGNIQFRVMLE
jgi:hypothetical protein